MIEDKDKSSTSPLRKFWYRLTEPPASVEEPGGRRQARLLASLLTIFVALTTLIVVTLAMPDTSTPAVSALQNPDLYVVAGATVLFAIAYSINRAGHYKPAAMLTVGAISIGVFAIAVVVFAGLNPYYAPTDIAVLDYMVLPVLFASILLSVPATIIVAALNAIGMVLLPTFFPETTLAAAPPIFVISVYVLTILGARHRAQLEVDRRSELAEKEEQYRSLLETTFEGIIVSEKGAGEVIDVNLGAAKMFGYAPSEAIGMPLPDFIAAGSRDLLARKVDAGIERPVESVGLRKDGTEFHVELVTQALTYRGRPTRIVAIRDNTERKQAEETLRQQTRELKLLNQVGRALGSTLDLNQVLTTILEEVRRLLGVIAASVWLVDPETNELVCQQAVGHKSEVVRGWRLPPGEGIAGRVATSGESLIVPDTRADERHFKEVDQQTGLEQRSILTVPLLAKERVIGVLQVMDLEAERFRPEVLQLIEALAASAAMAIENARLYEETEGLRVFNENIVQNMNDGILLEDATGYITFVNPKGAEILGYTPEELTGQHWKDIVPPEHIAKIEEEADRRPQGIASQYEAGLLTREGQQVPVIVSAQPLFEDGQFSGVLAVFTDITEHKQAEEEIHRRAAQQEALNAIIAAAATASDLQELLEITLDYTLQTARLDIGGIWLENQLATRGLPAEHRQLIAQTIPVNPPDIPGTLVVEDWQQREDSLRTAADQRAAHLGIHAYLTVPILAEGRRIGGLNLASSTPRPWSAEEIALAEAVGRQMGAASERLRLLEKTQDQARQIQQIVDTVPAGILLLAPDLHILLANPAAREHLVALCGGEDFGELSQTTETTLTHLGGYSIEELLTPPTEGLWHEVEVGGPPRRVFEVVAYAITSGPEAESWVLVLQDVTQEREIKERIQQQERLAVVGQLAAGIAHDFNNIMSVIILYAGMMLRKPDLTPKDRERLVIISQQAKQATNLTGQILDFSRTSVIERRALDLVPFLKELIKLLKRTLPENIELELVYGHDDYTVNADPTRIQQVVMNLVVNARDAMPEGGEMRIGLERILVGPGEPPPLPEMEPGEWVQMTASDTGAGIPPNALPHIFEPFFTTKPTGQGTGLGLAQVYGIVGQHGGHIDVESEVEHGTTFTLYLPALRVSGGEPLELEVGTPVHGHGETILVVEDEPATRDAVAEALQSLGYQVLVAANGREALSIFEQHSDEIALVLSDLMMPGISGAELFRILKQKKPAVKIVAMTGYPLQFKARDLPVQDIADWLQKPLSAEQLAETVQRALET